MSKPVDPTMNIARQQKRVLHPCDLSETSRCVLHVVAYFANGTDPRVMIAPEQSGSSRARPAQEKALATDRCESSHRPTINDGEVH
jgi:hypothetical protein